MSLSLLAPQVRKHLSADALFRLVQSDFARLPDSRVGDTEMAFADARMSAFAMLSLKAPSLLACDKERAEGNWYTLYGIERVPGDTRLREILDPISPPWLRPACKSVLRQLQRGQALEAMPWLGGQYLWALDGPGDFSAKTIHGASWVRRVHRHGSITSAHQKLGAASIHPDQRAVMPLRPEPRTNRDGTDKNDGERTAAQRFVAKLRQEPPHRTFIVTEERLRSHAPPIETLPAHGLHDILGGKDGEPASLFQQGQAAEHAGRVTDYERHDRAAGVLHRVRFVNDMPLNAARTDVRVHGIEYWEGGDDKVQPFSGVTDLRVSQRHVSHLMRGGRARWKIDNETCKTLKNQGDHFAHHYGHGEDNRSVVFAMLMMLAFVVDQPPQRGCAWFQAVWTKRGSKRRRWERMRALLYDSAFASMRQLFEALFYGFKKSSPLVVVEAS